MQALINRPHAVQEKRTAAHTTLVLHEVTAAGPRGRGRPKNTIELMRDGELTVAGRAYQRITGIELARPPAWSGEPYLVGNAQSLKDIVIRSGLRPGEGLYFDKDSRVLVNSPRFHRAFELARQVRQRQLDAKVSAWSNEWAEGFRRGSIATDLTGAWMVGQMANWVAPSTKGLWRAAQLPENTFVGYGGSFYAIPRRARAENKALAWELIQLLTLEPALQLAAFKAQDAFPALVETHQDPFFEQPVAFLGGQPARVVWREAARRISSTEVHKQNNFADEVISTELDNVLDRGKPIGQALADAQRLLERRAHR